MNFLSSIAKLVIGIVITPVLCVAAQAQAPKGTLKTQIDTVVKAEIKRQEIPGLSVAVLSKQRIVFSKAYGMADLENQVPVTTHSLFRTASVAKPITATAATILWQQGKLDLDAPIQRYCPAFPEKPWPITARQLLGI
jgi:serine beta-lactamase-like protein LACTB